MKSIIELRRELHAHAELSGAEAETNAILNDWIRDTHPDCQMEQIGGYGLAAVYKGKEAGKRILIRGDIDALNITEPGTMSYKSQHEGVSHKCGHDGHSAILCALAQRLAEHRPEKGEVVLLFQPAEETGQGAKAILSDPLFQQIVPDAAYGLHNIPGFEKGTILVRKGCFAAASFGLKLTLDGKAAHASQPETGRNPSEILAIMMHELEKKRELLKDVKPLTTFVITHASLGEATFGIAPGHAEIWLTLRSYDNSNLERLASQIIEFCQSKAKNRLIDFGFTMHEAFAATVNDDRNVGVIEKAAKALRLNVGYLREPFPWSEDFGRFSNACPIGFFGLASGYEQPPLHNAAYDFPDDIIETGADMFDAIIRLETS